MEIPASWNCFIKSCLPPAWISATHFAARLGSWLSLWIRCRRYWSAGQWPADQWPADW